MAALSVRNSVVLGCLSVAACDLPDLVGGDGGVQVATAAADTDCSDDGHDGTPFDAGVVGPGPDAGGGGGPGPDAGGGAWCGDGMVNGGELCDDGNTIDGDGCDIDCTASQVIDVEAGAEHTCVLLDTGLVKCWGANYAGTLGQGHTDAIGDDELPSSIPTIELDDRMVQISAGDGFTCGVTENAEVRCWGLNDHGQLGLGHTSNLGDDELPMTAGPATLPAGNVVQVVTGSIHACAVYDDGEIACWGANDFGATGHIPYVQIGDNEAVSTAAFVDVPGSVDSLSAGALHTCAVLDTGAVRCWGRGYEGQLGLGNLLTIGDDESPSTVGEVAINYTAIAMSSGGVHNCGLLDVDALKCWGSGAYGQLDNSSMSTIGDDEPHDWSVVTLGGFGPTRVPVQVVSNSFQTCARMQDGGVQCWGEGMYGALGHANTDSLGDDEYAFLAGDVDVGGPVVDVTVGGDHTCALLDDGDVLCWGLGWSGRLGYGSTTWIGDNELPVTAGPVSVF